MAALPFAIDVGELERRRRAGEPLTLLDVREPWELELARFEGALEIPLAALPAALDRLPRDGILVVACHHGMRSARATEWLRAGGFANAVNLAGGIDAFAREIDQGMGTY
jgi:rhodanese-related sulfurtransferase